MQLHKLDKLFHPSAQDYIEKVEFIYRKTETERYQTELDTVETNCKAMICFCSFENRGGASPLCVSGIAWPSAIDDRNYKETIQGQKGCCINHPNLFL